MVGSPLRDGVPPHSLYFTLNSHVSRVARCARRFTVVLNRYVHIPQFLPALRYIFESFETEIVFFHEGENIRLHPALVYTAENPCGRQASKGMQFSLPCMYVYIVAVSKAACCENG